MHLRAGTCIIRWIDRTIPTSLYSNCHPHRHSTPLAAAQIACENGTFVELYFALITSNSTIPSTLAIASSLTAAYIHIDTPPQTQQYPGTKIQNHNLPSVYLPTPVTHPIPARDSYSKSNFAVPWVVRHTVETDTLCAAGCDCAAAEGS